MEACSRFLCSLFSPKPILSQVTAVYALVHFLPGVQVILQAEPPFLAQGVSQALVCLFVWFLALPAQS